MSLKVPYFKFMLELDLSWDHRVPLLEGSFSPPLDLAHYLNFSREFGRRVGGKGDFDEVQNNHLVVNPGTWHVQSNISFYEKRHKEPITILCRHFPLLPSRPPPPTKKVLRDIWNHLANLKNKKALPFCLEHF